MKKVFLLMMCVFLTVGCTFGMTKNTPKGKAEEFIKQYKKMDKGVINDLELMTETTGLTTTEEKDKYIDIMKNQYKNLMYKVENEEINGDEAVVTMKISVYDIYKAKKDAEKYTIENEKEFYKSDNELVKDISKVNNYVLGKMKAYTNKVDYTIKLSLTKKDGKWVVNEPDTETKEKIHGLYNYESM